MRVRDRLFNLKQSLLRRPWFMRRPNYTGPIEIGMLFIWRPGTEVECQTVVSRISSNRCSDNRVIWSKPRESAHSDSYGVQNSESTFREAVGMYARPEYDAASRRR